MRQAQHIQTYVSVGESRATPNGGLSRGFSTACQTTGRFTFPLPPDKSLMTQGFASLTAACAGAVFKGPRGLKGGLVLKVYLAVWCPHCRMTETFLRENGIEYLAVDIEKASKDVVKAVVAVNGGEDWVVPTLEYRGKWRRGKAFDAAGLKSDLIEMGVIR